MSYILPVITFIYALLMSIATIQLVNFQEHPFVFIINMIGSLCLLLYFKDYRFLYVGVFILFVAAILNGYIVLNRLTLSHIIIRLFVSLILISANYFLHNHS